MSRKIKIGILGGGFSRAFQFHEHPQSEVVAVAEMRPERLQELKNHYHCDTGYPTFDEMLKDTQVEAVGIFSGAPDHARHAIAALKAGKHVLSAVPAAFSLDECHALLQTVQSTGLTYMMAETSYYRNATIQARDWHSQGKFGEIFYTEGEYWHENLEPLMFDNGKPTWRHGLPPMHYPTHSTAFLVGVTGERLVRVRCIGWGDDSEILKNNAYNNPFWNEMAMFDTDKGHASRMIVGWHVGYPEVERATWYGDKFSYAMASPIGNPDTTSQSTKVEKIELSNYYERLPEPLRHSSGHGGSHTHITHEFISALLEERRPAIDIYEALAYTAPGIVAHQSALKGGESLPVPNFGRGA